ncbi:hypothetical protein S83_005197, partial [Arachis hypogaea]
VQGACREGGAAALPRTAFNSLLFRLQFVITPVQLPPRNSLASAAVFAGLGWPRSLLAVEPMLSPFSHHQSRDARGRWTPPGGSRHCRCLCRRRHRRTS